MNPATKAPGVRASWAWVVPLAVALLAFAARGAPFGEPVADDFAFLHPRVFGTALRLFDGGGSLLFWRPIAHQAYYALLGEVILSHPRWIGIIHAALLTAAGMLLYRTARRFFDGLESAAVATFPILMEGARGLLTWPSHFVDLGMFLFTAAALHEAAHRRPFSAGAALLAALLCKELAVLAAPAIALSGALSDPSRRRRLWIAAALVPTLLWAIGYGIAAQSSRIRPSLLIAGDSDGRHGLGLWTTLWGLTESFCASLSLPPQPAAAVPALASILAIAMSLLWLAAMRQRARARSTSALIAPGIAWFILSSAVLGSLYPIWAPNRAVFGSIGLGVALVASLSVINKRVLLAVIGFRILTMLASPTAAHSIAIDTSTETTFLDLPRLTRLQRLVLTTRSLLRDELPHLPHGANIGYHYFPRRALYAFDGDRALQVWYRDSTLHFVSFDNVTAPDSAGTVYSIVEFQPSGPRQMATVDPEAMKMHLLGLAALRRGLWQEALARLSRSDSIQIDRRALVLLASNAYNRAFCLAALGRRDEAIRAAYEAIGTGQVNSNARYVLALIWAGSGERDLAHRQLDSLLSESPGDRDAQRLKMELQ